MSNRAMPPTPTLDRLVDDNQYVTTPWSTWFNRVHRTISNRNHQVLTGAGAIDVDAVHVSLPNTSCAVTLDAPTIPGLFKIIQAPVISGGSTITMSLTNVVIAGSTPTTATWDATRDTLVLVSLTDKWLILNNYNVTLT